MMVIDLSNVQMFDNICLQEINGVYYDLHNEFNCTKVIFKNDELSLNFEKLDNQSHLSINFSEVKIENFELIEYIGKDGLTIDNLYRGRYEKNGKLIDISVDQKIFIYLDFYEGYHFEFWASKIEFNI